MNRKKEESVRWLRVDFKLLFLFIVTGIFTGLTITCYKLGIEKFAEMTKNFLHNYGGTTGGKAIFIGAFILMAIVMYYLSIYDPNIKGSGIPIIFGVLDGKFKVNWKRTLPLKFFTSIVTVGSGLTLGREGPSVQMGGLVGQAVHDVSKSNEERRVFVGAASGAGFAVAFNAPLTGIIFAVEEIYKKTSRKIFLSASATVIAAIIVSHLIVGNTPTLPDVPRIKSLELPVYFYMVVMGIFTGLSGVLYNYVVVGGKVLAGKIKINPLLKFIIPFVVTAIVILMDINLFGSGEHFILYTLGDNAPTLTLIYYYFMKLFLLAIIFAVGCPGGSLVPMLAMGALVGNIYGSIGVTLGLFDPSLIFVFSIIAMCGQFSAIVRAPLTGIVLVLEMTGGSFEYFFAVAIVAMIAYIIAEMFASKPFYGHLYEMMLPAEKKDAK